MVRRHLHDPQKFAESVSLLCSHTPVAWRFTGVRPALPVIMDTHSTRMRDCVNAFILALKLLMPAFCCLRTEDFFCQSRPSLSAQVSGNKTKSTSYA